MKRIVLVGAGHTHIELALRAREFVDAGIEVILINPLRSHPYSGMGPGLLSGLYSAADVLLPAAALIEQAGGIFVRDRVVAVDPTMQVVRLEHGDSLRYDVISFNLGSEPIVEVDGYGRFPVKPISSLAEARRAIELQSTRDATIRIAVIGGGPGGIELAANAAHLLDSLNVVRRQVNLYTGDSPLGNVRGRRERYVESALARAGVRINRGVRVSPDDIDADFVLVASGIRPPGVLGAFGLPLGDDGGILTDKYLRSTAFENVFAVGDCATMQDSPLDRVGVYAVRMQPILLSNLRFAVSDGKDESDPAALLPFTGRHKYLAGFNLGYGRGLLYRGRWTVTGRTAFRIKNRIDCGFMRRYQQAVRTPEPQDQAVVSSLLM